VSALAAVTEAEGYASSVLRQITRLASAQLVEEAVDVLRTGAEALGAERSLFCSFIRDDDNHENFRFMLACDPAWCLEYQAQAWYTQDPWLIYAHQNSEPTSASHIEARSTRQQQAIDLAKRYAFASAYIVPAHSMSGLTRLGVMVLGSAQPGYFDDAHACVPMRPLARALATELHEWWVRKIAAEIRLDTRLTDDDLTILRLVHKGLRTKQIAAETGLQSSAIDSRMTRLCARLNTPNRSAAARLVAEYGLIPARAL
jgi:DNA-binding CsgD family transcriptional regulator